MQIDKNRNSVLRQLAALQKMSLSELQDKWRDLYGSEPPSYGRDFMFRQLAYRLQELFYGGLKKEIKEVLHKSNTNNRDAKNGKKSDFTIGTQLVRMWNKKEHKISVVQGGFEYEGQRFRSLTAIAEKITGSHWNGRHFFGLPKMNRRPHSMRIKRKINEGEIVS